MMTINALACADSVLIPVQAAYLPVKGLQQLIKTIGRVKRQLNQKLEIEGILITMVDNRTNYAKDISAQIYEAYSSTINVFETEIPLSVRAAEISASGSSLYVYDPKGKAAFAYTSFIKEVMNNGTNVPSTEGTVDLDVMTIYPFENHPFKVVDDEKMDELVESIKESGVLTPVLVRPDDEGTYEMISGHRRLHAAKRAGLRKIPAIIKEMTNDDATIAI